MYSRHDPRTVRSSGRLLTATFRHPEWLQASVTPVGGLFGLIVLNSMKGLAAVWHRWIDPSGGMAASFVLRPAIAFFIGGLSGWLLVVESSHLVMTLAAAALVLAVVGVCGETIQRCGVLRATERKHV